MEAQEIVLQLPGDKVPADHTMVLTVGIGFGKIEEIHNGIQ